MEVCFIMSEKIKVGVVGLGNMGSSHIKWISESPKMELAAICDIKDDVLERYTKQYNVKGYSDSHSMIESGDIEAIVISVPHYDHTPIAVDAFEHNLHVLTEKPIAVHKNDALKMIAAHAKHPDRKFAAMFQMRTDPAMIKIKKLITSGVLGKITRVNWIVTTWFRSQTYYNSSSWRATWKGEGGGVLFNQCPHHIDLFQWFFGMPSKVRAYCSIGKYHDIEVEDEVTAYFEYPNGATGVFVTSTAEAPGTNRLEIVADNGRVVFEDGKLNFRRNDEPVSSFTYSSKTLFGIPEIWDASVEIRPDAWGHAMVLANFADAINGEAELIAPAEEGLNAVELANSMLYSSMNHEEVVFPLDGDKYKAMLDGLIENSKFVKKTGSKVASVDFEKSFNKNS